MELRHAQEMLDFITANREYLGDWFDWVYRVDSVEKRREFIQNCLKQFADDGLPLVGIWQDDQLVGGIYFFPVNKHISATEIGYWLGSAAAGRGLMSRAIRAMLGYVFHEVKINRIALQAELTNTRSRAVAERLGFTFEGIRRQVWVHGGQRMDMASYAMLAEDWQEARGES
jgi:ribosomal-protein-serine acetyltransferase